MSENEVTKLIVKNEKDAFELLKKSLKNEIPENSQLVFEGWPIFKLSIYGEDFDSTIPTRVMPPILELQKEIHRIYCRAKYNTDSLANLKDYERDMLELVVQVQPGCSEYISDVFKSLNEAIKSTNMTGPQAVTLFLGIAAIISGTYSWKSWLAHNERIHNQEVSIRMSEEETKRQELLIEALTSNNDVKKAQQGVDAFRSSLSKKLKPEDTIKVNNQNIIDGEKASQVIPKPRIEAEVIRIDGDFQILEAKFPKDIREPYKFIVQRLNDGLKLSVDATHEALAPEQVKILKDGGFELKTVVLEINARKLRDNITNAKLHKISWPTETE